MEPSGQVAEPETSEETTEEVDAQEPEKYEGGPIPEVSPSEPDES